MRYTLTLPAPKQHRYWLVETASLPENEVLRRFYATVQQPMFRWLYDGTAYQAVRDSGPVLLDITQDASVWHQFSAEWAGKAASVVIDTSESLDELHRRLAICLTIKTRGNGVGLLRFHEAAALHLLLGEEMLSLDNRVALMGESACWSWVLCQSQGGIVYEHYCSPKSVNNMDIAGRTALRLEDVTQQRLSSLTHFSRLMPVLGKAIYRFNLLPRQVEITLLWSALERYWHATWQSRLPRKQVVENALGMLASSNALEHFIETLSLDAMRWHNKGHRNVSEPPV